MKHPLTKTLLAAGDRGGPSAWDALSAFMITPSPADPARDYALTLDLAAPGAVIAGAGPRLSALFGRSLQRLPFAWLFRASDREEVERLARAIFDGETGCILSARAAGGEGLALEGLLLPARRGDGSSRAEGVLAPFRSEASGPLGSLTLVSFRFVDASAPPATVGFARPGTARTAACLAGPRLVAL